MSDYIKQGWVRVYRKSMDSTVWKNPNIWFVWSWCLLKANHKKTKFPFNGEDIELFPGQFISGRNKALEELPVLTPQQWRTAIDYLKSTNRIAVNSNNKFSIITILNWNEYQIDNQQSNQPVTNQQPANNQPITTYKNVKNEKNSIVANRNKEFSLKEEIRKLNDSDRRDLNIIGLFFEETNPDLKTIEQYQVALKRHLTPAKSLKAFTDNQILDAIDYAKKKYKGIWTLETIIKILTK